MTLYLASTTEWCQSAATANISSPGHPNAAGCVQMCASINHWQDRRKRWWTGNTRLDKQNNEFQQPGPATHTLWPLFKHVLIMSPCLQLCKHILTLSSTLCCDWNLAQSQCWKKKKEENGRHRCCNRRWRSVAAGGEVRKRWMRNQEILKRSLHGRGKKRIKSLWTEGQKTDYSLFGEEKGRGGSEVRIFLCAIIHNQFTSETLTGSFTAPWQYSRSSSHLLVLGLGLPFLFPSEGEMLACAFPSQESNSRVS